MTEYYDDFFALTLGDSDFESPPPSPTIFSPRISPRISTPSRRNTMPPLYPYPRPVSIPLRSHIPTLTVTAELPGPSSPPPERVETSEDVPMVDATMAETANAQAAGTAAFSTPHECTCSNCSELVSRLSECGICMNPLQNAGVNACARCGGLWCGTCARKLPKCPFCRAPHPRSPCAAVARLLRDLTLPCRNQRWGCTAQLTAEGRLDHESVCTFGQIVCPLEELCATCLPFTNLANHILTAHGMTTIEASKVNIVIEKFANKMMNTSMTRHKYKICLLTHGNAFLVKISLFNFNLHVSIAKKNMRYEIQHPNMRDTPKEVFCALLGFQSTNMAHKCTLMLDDKLLSRRTLVQKNDVVYRSWPGEDVSVFITISHISDEKQVVVLL